MSVEFAQFQGAIGAFIKSRIYLFASYAHITYSPWI